jgi:hypothetical protein
MNVAAALDRSLRTAGIPIDGVSIGDPNDRPTWTITFAATATEAQRVEAAEMLAAFDPLDPAHVAEETDALAVGLADTGETRAGLRALCGTLLWQRLGRQPTPAEFTAEWVVFRQRFVAVYKAVN